MLTTGGSESGDLVNCSATPAGVSMPSAECGRYVLYSSFQSAQEPGLRAVSRTARWREVRPAAHRLSATSPDHVWAIDYQFDVTSMGKNIKILHITDEYTRQSLSDRFAYSIDADATVAELDRIVEQRGRHPEFIRMDNGPELTAYALRDWCRFTGAGTSYIDPGSPWQNKGELPEVGLQVVVGVGMIGSVALGGALLVDVACPRLVIHQL